MENTWNLTETAFSPATSRAWEGLFTQGSGYLQVRGSVEEHFTNAPQHTTYLRLPGNVTAEKFPETAAKWGTYVPGIFGKHPTLDVEMVNLPFFLLLLPTIDGERLDLTTSKISSYNRTLNLRNGLLTRDLVWQTTSGATIKLTFERFISMAQSHLAVQRLRIQSDLPVSLAIRTGIDADIRTSGHDHLTSRSLSAAGTDGMTCTVETDMGDSVRMDTRIQKSDCVWSYCATERAGYLETSRTLDADTPLVVERHTVVTTSRDLETVDADALLSSSLAAGYNTLLAEHTQIWEERWSRSDVSIDGDTDSQLALRCSIYHLLRCHVPNNPRVTIDAKGYAGDAYFGRFFWDTEMYMLPFYLYTDPERARTFAEFRIQSLPGARANAQSYGYPGARYPWESDPDGYERCPNWQYRDHEIHVTGDVVYGLAHVGRAVPSWNFLEQHAAEVVVETARYWMGRIDYREGELTPSLLGVMGPDEYAPITSNNAYTNRMACYTLALAAGDIGKAGGASDEERAKFQDIANTLPLPRSADGKLVLQCEEFPRLADPQFDLLWADRSKGYANNVSQERMYRNKAMKQADVLMLMMLFPQEFTDEEVQRAWDYYLPYTTHDSSLSAGAHAIVACRLNKPDDAWEFWTKTIGYDLDIAHGGAAEGIHIANAAASWMVAVFGFAGMATAMEVDTLHLRPQLPQEWTRLAFPLVWKETPFQIAITKTEISITNNGQTEQTVCVGDTTLTIAAGQTETASL